MPIPYAEEWTASASNLQPLRPCATAIERSVGLPCASWSSTKWRFVQDKSSPLSWLGWTRQLLDLWLGFFRNTFLTKTWDCPRVVCYLFKECENEKSENKFKSFKLSKSYPLKEPWCVENFFRQYITSYVLREVWSSRRFNVEWSRPLTLSVLLWPLREAVCGYSSTSSYITVESDGITLLCEETQLRRSVPQRGREATF